MGDPTWPKGSRVVRGIREGNGKGVIPRDEWKMGEWGGDPTWPNGLSVVPMGAEGDPTWPNGSSVVPWIRGGEGVSSVVPDTTGQRPVVSGTRQIYIYKHSVSVGAVWPHDLTEEMSVT